MLNILTLPYISKYRAMAQLYASKESVRKSNVEKTRKYCVFVSEVCNARRLQHLTFILKVARTH
jgi:hypothetical protein